MVLLGAAAILLLIPGTAPLGAIIYFPIILNISILTFAVRFDGSLLTAPLMVLANSYLLCWDYHKLRLIFPFNHSAADKSIPRRKDLSNKFPTLFFAGVVATVFTVMLVTLPVYNFRPRNTLSDCKSQCDDCRGPHQKRPLRAGSKPANDLVVISSP